MTSALVDPQTVELTRRYVHGFKYKSVEINMK